MKARLYEAGLKPRSCEECGQGEYWQDKWMSLILDHINGVSNDNRIENLRVVCPNCAATLESHCGRNLPRERTCPGCGDVFEPRNLRHRYCSQACWGIVRSRPEFDGDGVQTGVPRPASRKVKRPPYEQLLAEIEATNFEALGRSYGVSGNAVRKWVRFYEREAERVGREKAPRSEAVRGSGSSGAGVRAKHP